MKAKLNYNKMVLLIFLLLFILGAIIGKFLIPNPEAAAEKFLRSIYSAVPEDFEKIQNLFQTSNTLEEEVINNVNSDGYVNYIHSLYNDRLTEQGYEICFANRLFFQAPSLAYKKNAEVNISKISLEEIQTEEEDKYYRFHVQCILGNDSDHEIFYEGTMKLRKENKIWKVDMVTF